MHPHTKLPSETPLFRLSFQDMQSIHYENYTQLKEGSASTPSLLDISNNDNVYYLYPYQGGMGIPGQ